MVSKSLAEFVADIPKRGCLICQLAADIRSQVDAAIVAKSASYATISAWLKTQGHKASPDSIRRHGINHG